MSGGADGGGVPFAVAVLSMPPLSTSAWVTVYVAVHVTGDSVGDNVAIVGVPSPQSIADRPGSGSLTLMSVSVTVPVFATSNEYVMTSPAAAALAGSAVLARVSSDVWSVSTVSVSAVGGIGSPPPGGVPVTDAVLVIAPASMSACVTEYVAVHVTGSSAGASEAIDGEPSPQSTSERPGSGSVTVTAVSVTLPVLSTSNE